MPIPGIVEDVIESPIMIGPLAVLTFTGTRPARATAGRSGLLRLAAFQLRSTRFSSMTIPGLVVTTPMAFWS